MHRKSKCSNVPTPSICGTETGALHQGKAIHFQISLCSYSEKVRPRIHTAEMRFLRRISGLTLLDKVKSADIRESLNIESLLLRLERSQLRWYGHVTRMSHERTAKKLLLSTPIGRRPRGRPRTRWQDYVEDLSWSCLGIPAEHLSFVAEDRDAWRLQLELLSPRPAKDKWVQKSK